MKRMDVYQCFLEKYPSGHCPQYPCSFIKEILAKQNKLDFVVRQTQVTWIEDLPEWSIGKLTCNLCAMETVVWDIVDNPTEENKYENSEVLELTRFYVHCLDTYLLYYGLHPSQSKWARFIRCFRRLC